MGNRLVKHVMLLVFCVTALALSSQLVLAENLLVNPGFESNVNVWGTNNQYASANNWTGFFPGALSYVEPEVAGYVPDPLTPHSGANAVRHVTDVADPAIQGWVIMYQDVRVVPGEVYTASIWLKAVDVAGKGFGQHPAWDSAKLWVQEYAADGTYLNEYIAAAQMTPTDWTQQTLGFTAGSSTYTVRFMVETKIQCGSTPTSTEGYVGYDDASLEGPRGVATVSGTVTAGGAAAPDALVTIGAKTATTGIDGTYTITDVPTGLGKTSIVCTKTGYYTETRRVALWAGANTVDIVLIAFPTNNILANPGWEEGGPTAPYGWNGNGGPDAQGYGWKAHFNLPVISQQEFIRQESDYPTPVVHTGVNAIRCTLGGTANAMDVWIYQDIFVKGATEYTARVWAKGSGAFGTYSTDARGLWIQEFDSNGNLVPGGDHPKQLLNTGTDEYEPISETFTTNASTVRVRYCLIAVESERSSTAWVNFDDSILDGPAGTTTLSGVVRGDGVPLAGATVSAGGVSAVSGEDGTYAIDLSGKGSLFDITASKTGYVSELKQRTLQFGENILDFDLYSATNNLLANPGWEELSPGSEGLGWQGYDQTKNTEFHHYGWNAAMRGNTNSAFWQEMSYGDKTFHSGKNAMRFVTTNSAGNAYAYQDVLVRPEAQYTARLFIKARGQFGADPGDSAGMWITEYDIDGNPVEGGDHGKVELKQPVSDYVLQTMTFVTQPTTARIRYAVDCVIMCAATAGSITFDDAVLDGPAGESMVLSGVVTSEGVPVAGATVRAGGTAVKIPAGSTVTIGLQDSTARTAVTGPDGTFTINMGVLMTRILATASKPGYYNEPVYVTQKPGTMVVNFSLTQLPASNLIANPGWEKGLPVWSGVSPKTWSANGWKGRALSGVTTVIEREWDFLQSWNNTVALHGGGNAVRNVAIAANGHMDQYQEAAALPNTTYRAGVWVRCGGLFGADPNDSAGMHICEYDASGTITLDHPKIEQKTATTSAAYGGYVWVRQLETFVTQPTTATIRYTLDTVVAGKHPQTWLTYDDCFLDGPGGTYTTVANIGSLAGLADETKVAVDKIITVKIGTTYFYIEELDRSAGIRVQGSGTVGNWAEIRGTIRTIAGERTLVPDLLLQSASGTTIKPLGMTNRVAGAGLSRGLFVKMWGKVDTIGTGYFTMTDGSGTSLKVISTATVVTNDYVAVTGALGAEISGVDVIPVLRAVTVTKVGP